MAKRKRKTSGRSTASRRKNRTQDRMPAGLITLFAGLVLMALAFVPGSSAWRTMHDVLFGVFGCGSFVLGAALCYLAILYTRGEDLLPHIAKLVLGLIFASGTVIVFSDIPTDQTAAQMTAACYHNGMSAWLSGGALGAVLGGTLLLLCGRPAANLVMAALAAALSAPLPRLLRAEQEIWRDASAYFLVYSLFLPALQLDNVAAGQLQATGNMRTPGVCMVLMCALDVVFNTLLIFPTGTIRLGALSLPGAGLGTAGAALGTGLAELAVGLYLLYFVLRRSPALRLEKGERLHLDRTQLRMVLRIAAPVASEKVILSTAQIVSTAIVAPLGTVAIAANSFAVTAESLCYMPAYGIQSAAAMLVGQSVGAGRRRMARRLGWVTVLLGIVVMVVTGGLLYAFAPQMMAILTPDSDIIALGTRVLRIEAFAEAMYGASIVAGGVFQGAGSTLVPTLFNLGTMWGIRLPLAWLAAPRWGLPGVWAAMCAELCVRGLLYLIRLGGKRWLPPEGPAGQV